MKKIIIEILETDKEIVDAMRYMTWEIEKEWNYNDKQYTTKAYDMDGDELK